MSVELEIERTVDICIYGVSCGECDRELTYDAKADGDGDIFVTVAPCENCLDEAGAAGAAGAEQ